jgi:hypothetical protein
MTRERVDISKWRVPDTGNRTSIVQEFPDIGAAAAHALEPSPRHQSVRIGDVEKPSIDPRITSDRTGEPQQIIHLIEITYVRRLSEADGCNFRNAFHRGVASRCEPRDDPLGGLS